MSDNSFRRRQLLSLGLVSMLAIALRIFPSETAALAGRAAWLSPFLALPPLLGYMYFLSRLLACRREEENFQDLTLRALGPKAGKAALLLLSLWMLLCAGFALRAGVDRLIVTTYPNASPVGFTLVMGLLSLCAALGSPRTLARMGRILQPVILGVLGLIALFALFSVNITALWPISSRDIIPAAAGSLVTIEIVGCAACAMCLVSGGMKKEDGDFAAFGRYCLGSALLLSLLAAAILGSFGPELSAKLARPFFVLVKNMVFFRTVERIEALVVMLWIFPDFLLISLFLWAGQYSLRLMLGFDGRYRGEGFFDFSSGRALIWFSAFLVTLFALFAAQEALSLELWSSRIMPYTNMFFAFVFFPLIYIIGRKSGRL